MPTKMPSSPPTVRQSERCAPDPEDGSDGDIGGSGSEGGDVLADEDAAAVELAVPAVPPHTRHALRPAFGSAAE